MVFTDGHLADLANVTFVKRVVVYRHLNRLAANDAVKETAMIGQLQL